MKVTRNGLDQALPSKASCFGGCKSRMVAQVLPSAHDAHFHLALIPDLTARQVTWTSGHAIHAPSEREGRGAISTKLPLVSNNSLEGRSPSARIRSGGQVRLQKGVSVDKHHVPRFRLGLARGQVSASWKSWGESRPASDQASPTPRDVPDDIASAHWESGKPIAGP